MTDPFTKALRAQMRRNLEAAAFRASVQAQRDAKARTLERDRLEQERQREEQANFLQQEQDKLK